MQKLYSYFKSLSLILLCSAGAIPAMKIDSSQQHPTDQLMVAPSLKDLCINYIKNNAHDVNLIENLIKLPNELTAKIILSTDSTYIDHHKAKFINLAQSNIDTTVSCAIAQKLNNVQLAYDVAKNGSITRDVASIIIQNFLNTDITTCLTDFNSIFNRAFPKEILAHGNDNRLYQLLMHKITANFYYVDWEKNDKNLFSAQDFEQHVFTTNQITAYAAKKGFINKNFDSACTNGYVTLSPCKNFLAFTELHPKDKTYNWFEIHSLKTGNTIKVINKNNFLVNKIAFSKDCSHFGIQDKEGTISNFTLTSMLCNNLPLKKMASLVYCYMELTNKFHITDGTETGLGYLLFEGEIGDEEDILVDFTQNTILADVEVLPIHIKHQIESSVSKLRHARSMVIFLDMLSEKSEMTKKEIAWGLFINHDEKITQNALNIIKHIPDSDMQVDMHAAIHYLSPLMFLFLDGF